MSQLHESRDRGGLEMISFARTACVTPGDLGEESKADDSEQTYGSIQR